MFDTENNINKLYDDITTEKNKLLLELKNIDDKNITDEEIKKENCKKRNKIEKKILILEQVQKSIIKYRNLI